MDEFGISAFGAYIPRQRVPRRQIAEAHAWMAPGLRALAKGNRSYCSWDEDAITMAVEAARNCGVGGAALPAQALYLASTTFPYADLQNAALVAAALGLPRETRTLDLGGSQRSATGALVAAILARETSLVAASDKPNGKPGSNLEMSYGAAAAAFVLSSSDILARCLAHACLTEPFVDHFRASGEAYDYYWEERWIRDEGYLRIVPAVVGDVLARAQLAIEEVQHLIVASPFRGIAQGVAKQLRFPGKVAQALDQDVGYAGAAHPLLMLCDTLEQAEPGQRILVVGFGQGADAILFEVTDLIRSHRPQRRVSEEIAAGIECDSYERMLAFQKGIELDWGMRSEKSGKTALTEQSRSSAQIASFSAARCPTCGTVQFPALEYCVNPACHAPGAHFVAAPMASERGQVVTYTADWLSYHPSPPNNVGFVQFANGVRLQMEFVDVGPAGLEVGQWVRPVMRIKERDPARAYSRYFWKAAPCEALED